MSVFDQPANDMPSEVIRALWPERTPSVELRTRTLLTATATLRHVQANKAKPKAQRLAVAVYVCGFVLVLLTMLGFSSTWHETLHGLTRWATIGALALCSIGACLLAVFFAARWCQVMRLPRELRWAPLISMLGVFAIIAGVVSQSSVAADTRDLASPDQETLPAGLQYSMNAVSSALTRTMTISQSQDWLNTNLPRNVERAWFVTPEGLVALSSITTVNEISRSVMDYIAITQTSAVQNTGLSHHDLAALASLRGHDTLTRAMAVSTTPVVLLVMVKQALVNLSHTPQNAQIYTELIPSTDGSLAGISAIAWQPSAPYRFAEPALLIATGFAIIGIAWASWVYFAERGRLRKVHHLRAHPWRWAIFTALLVPVGLLAYLFNQSDEG